jgi:hypothetical protein
MKICFERTNKQYHSAEKDMLLNFRIQRHTKLLNSYNSNKMNSDNNTKSKDYRTLTCYTIDKLIFQNSQFYVQNKAELLQTDSDNINKVLLSFADVIKIADETNFASFKNLWNQFKQNKCQCYLPAAVRCSAPSDFDIHCNHRTVINRGSNEYKSVFDFVEIKYVDDMETNSEIAQLICIFRFNTNEMSDTSSINETYFLMICWMKKEEQNESVLPFPVYKYNIVTSRRPHTLYFGIVSIENILRPACLIPHKLQYDLTWSDRKKKQIDELKNLIFYCLRYDILVRDHCENFVEFTGEYRRLTSSSSSTSSRVSSSSSSSTSTSSNSILENSQLILSDQQINEINEMLSEDMNIESNSDNDPESDSDNDPESDSDNDSETT